MDWTSGMVGAASVLRMMGMNGRPSWRTGDWIPDIHTWLNRNTSMTGYPGERQVEDPGRLDIASFDTEVATREGEIGLVDILRGEDNRTEGCFPDVDPG